MKNHRIHLLNCSLEIVEFILKGDEAISSELGLNVPPQWSEFGVEIFRYTLESIKTNPKASIWWGYLPILTETNTLIGTCGFKGEPTEGMVEIGYEVAKSYRNNGYATEIAEILIQKAFESEFVDIVIAHTLAEENPSVKILRKKGFQFIKEMLDPDDGKIWQWQLNKSKSNL